MRKLQEASLLTGEFQEKLQTINLLRSTNQLFVNLGLLITLTEFQLIMETFFLSVIPEIKRFMLKYIKVRM